MESLAKIVPQIAGKYKLKEEMDSSFVLEKTKQMIEEFFGKEGLKNLIPQKIIFNKIFIKASNSGWAQELHLQKHSLLEKLNQEKLKKILDLKVFL